MRPSSYEEVDNKKRCGYCTFCKKVGIHCIFYKCTHMAVTIMQPTNIYENTVSPEFGRCGLFKKQ
jgi:hypothetical protein